MRLTELGCRYITFDVLYPDLNENDYGIYLESLKTCKGREPGCVCSEKRCHTTTERILAPIPFSDDKHPKVAMVNLIKSLNEIGSRFEVLIREPNYLHLGKQQ